MGDSRFSGIDSYAVAALLLDLHGDLADEGVRAEDVQNPTLSHL